MESLRHLTLMSCTALLLTACGGEEEKQPALWETFTTQTTPESLFSARARDLTLDTYGDLITLGAVSYDSDPSTVAIDAKHDIYLMKQDRSGAVIWETTLDTPSTRITSYEVQSDYNGNLYVVGDGFIVATDPQGTLRWQDTYEDLALSVTVSGDRVYVPGRTTRIYDLDGNLELTIDNGDIYPWQVVLADNGDIIQATWNAITRHTAAGDLIWSAPAPDDVTTRASVALDDADNVYVSFLTDVGNSGGNTAAARMVKINNAGEQEWYRFIPDNRPSSNYYKSGTVHTFIASNGDVVHVTAGSKGRQITRINSDNGSVIWEKVHANTGTAHDAHLADNDQLILVGDNNPQTFDAQGNLISSYAQSSPSSTNSLAIYGNQFFVNGSNNQDGDRSFYTAAYSR